MFFTPISRVLLSLSLNTAIAKQVHALYFTITTGGLRIAMVEDARIKIA
jgi:hypothetical protein